MEGLFSNLDFSFSIIVNTHPEISNSQAIENIFNEDIFNIPISIIKEGKLFESAKMHNPTEHELRLICVCTHYLEPYLA